VTEGGGGTPGTVTDGTVTDGDDAEGGGSAVPVPEEGAVPAAGAETGGVVPRVLVPRGTAVFLLGLDVAAAPLSERARACDPEPDAAAAEACTPSRWRVAVTASTLL
jgi:hypothetical protein